MFILSDLYPNPELIVGKKSLGALNVSTDNFIGVRQYIVYPTAQIIERSKNAWAICKTNKHLTQESFFSD